MSDSRMIPGTSRSYKELERDLGEIYQSVLPYRLSLEGNSELFVAFSEILNTFSTAYGVRLPDEQERGRVFEKRGLVKSHGKNIQWRNRSRCTLGLLLF